MSKIVVLGIVALLFAGCGGPTPQSTSNSTSSAPTPVASSPSPKTEFEENLQYIRNGQFTYVYAFSRKDGKPLEPADSAFLRTNAPQVVDWVLADKLKTKILAGTNFNLEEGNLNELRKRFVVEDYSGR